VPLSSPPQPAALFARYQQLVRWVDLNDADFEAAIAAWALVRPQTPHLIDDFYEQILQNPSAASVFDDAAQVERLKNSLGHWLEDLFAGNYDADFVRRRWQVGYRHVQIGLPSIWVSVAMSRLRDRALTILRQQWRGDATALHHACSAISRMLDVDLALIQDAYNTESTAKRVHRERDFAEGVIETAQAVVMVVDCSGAIIRGNAFLKRLLGSPPQPPEDQPPATESAPAAKHIDQLLAPGERESFLQFIRRAAGDDPPGPLETELYREASPPRQIRWMARPYLPVPSTLEAHEAAPRGNDDGWVLCVGQDITDLTIAQRQLVRHARLAAIGQTMTGLAHESRNAFQRSQAALETLLLDLDDRPSAVQLIERIQRAHDHLLHLYEEVLQFARPVRLELQQLHLDSVLRQTWDHLHEAVAEQGVECDLRTDPDLPAIEADPFAIEQIIRNLLENAIEASPPGGLLEVTIQHQWLGDQAAAELRVRDHGGGIPPEHRERLFEPFFTTRSRGTGLGLPIARRLAESHGGSLELEDASPGTVARLVLPRVAQPEDEEPPAVDYRRSS
jgi:hypothetical protein